MLSQKYQAEQQELIEKIDRLKAELAKKQQTVVDAEKWISLAWVLLTLALSLV